MSSNNPGVTDEVVPLPCHFGTQWRNPQDHSLPQATVGKTGHSVISERSEEIPKTVLYPEGNGAKSLSCINNFGELLKNQVSKESANIVLKGAYFLWRPLWGQGTA